LSRAGGRTVGAASPSPGLIRNLRGLVEPAAVLDPGPAVYGADATEGRGVRGRPDAVVLPSTAEEVAAVLAYCYEHDVAVVPRGGGSGFAGGAVPVTGGVVLGLERLSAVRALDPPLWRMHVEAGVPTARVQRIARENGLLFPPDPGAAEQSLIGGNIATNAGGPHAFKYGVTGAWVTGLEVVLAPGEVVRLGGPIRKDVAGYDLMRLMIGSEGTLGIITAAWLRLLPAPETALPLLAFYADAATGCEAIETVLASGLQPAALEFLDAGALGAAAGALPDPVPAGAGFAVIAEADGTVAEAQAAQAALAEVLGDGALALRTPTAPADVRALWRWRDGVSIAVTAQRGGKVSEDVVVPVDRLHEAILATLDIGARHDLEACSWGHAGDGNLHSTFLVDLDDASELARAAAAAAELHALAVDLGGSISGEHGLGWVRSGELALQWAPRVLAVHEGIKRLFDPKGLLNPGKKLAHRAT
jgi:glycolate oxidase subunit GlcD